MLLLFILFLISSSVKSNDYIITQRLIEKINKDPNSSWIAGVNPIFVGKTVKEVDFNSYFPDAAANNDIFKEYENDIIDVNELPEEYDIYEKYPKCKKEIRDQGKCVGCWAITGAEVLEDRYCIASNQEFVMKLSPQDMVSCEDDNDHCRGGKIIQQWSYLEKTGIVSEKCLPWNKTQTKLDYQKCPYQCVDKSDPWKKYKTKNGSTVHIKNYQDAMVSVYDKGSFQAVIMVYQDFLTYKSGVYEHKTGPWMGGGHSLKIHGWGNDKESGLDYWIGTNSFGTGWGMQGFFWIKRGTGECCIESWIYTAEADISHSLAI